MAYARQRDGKWYLGFRDQHGRWHEKASQASSKKDAERLAQELERKEERVRLGLEAAAPEPITFATFSADWLREVASQRRSQAGLESRLKCHLLPAFGKMLLTEISAQRIERFLAERARRLGPMSVEHLRRQLRAMLKLRTPVGAA
jgi:hypothetical protein